MKKITITLSDKAEIYFNEVLNSLDNGTHNPATQSEAINEILESNAVFEQYKGQSVCGYIEDNYNHYSKDKPITEANSNITYHFGNPL